MINFEAPLDQPTLKQVLEEESAEIADMRIIINRWPTSVHFDFARNQSDKCLFFAGQGIKKADAWLLRCHILSSIGYKSRNYLSIHMDVKVDYSFQSIGPITTFLFNEKIV